MPWASRSGELPHQACPWPSTSFLTHGLCEAGWGAQHTSVRVNWCLRAHLPLAQIWAPLCRAVLPRLPDLLSYVPHMQRMASSCPSPLGYLVPAAEACIFGMSFLGSAPPDKHADNCYAGWCLFTLSLIRALSHEVQNSEINWTAQGKVP